MKTPASAPAVLIASVVFAAAAGYVGAVSLSAPTAVAQAPAASGAMRIATVDVLAVVERLVLSDAYAPARDALAAEKNRTLEPFAKALEDLETKAKGLAQGAMELAPMQEQYQATKQRLDTLADAARREVEAFNVSQLGEAYRAVHEAAAAMADKLGYTHVVASKMGPTTLRSLTVNNAVQEMIARPVVKAPAEDDITQRLIDGMGLTNVVVPEVTPPAPEPAVAQPVPAEGAAVAPK